MMTITLFWVLVLMMMGWWMFGTPREARLPPHVEADLARLRDEVDRLSEQVGRLTEEQSYMTRLLAEGERRPVLPNPKTPDADT
jgi:hypothetical protein